MGLVGGEGDAGAQSPAAPERDRGQGATGAPGHGEGDNVTDRLSMYLEYSGDGKTSARVLYRILCSIECPRGIFGDGQRGGGRNDAPEGSHDGPRVLPPGRRRRVVVVVVVVVMAAVRGRRARAAEEEEDDEAAREASSRRKNAALLSLSAGRPVDSPPPPS